MPVRLHVHQILHASCRRCKRQPRRQWPSSSSARHSEQGIRRGACSARSWEQLGLHSDSPCAPRSWPSLVSLSSHGRPRLKPTCAAALAFEVRLTSPFAACETCLTRCGMLCRARAKANVPARSLGPGCVRALANGSHGAYAHATPHAPAVAELLGAGQRLEASSGAPRQHDGRQL